MTDNSVGFRSARGPVLIAVMLSTGLVAIDSTIIATAVPSIVKEIGGFTEFPWLFSIYLLAQAVSVPIYGKLNDLFGRKPVILGGIGLFLLGSVMCGVAWSIWPLIAFRVVLQGGAQLETVEVRHVDVRDEEGGPVLPYGFEGGPAVPGDHGLVTEPAHHFGDDPLMIDVVLCDNHTSHDQSLVRMTVYVRDCVDFGRRDAARKKSDNAVYSQVVG